MHKSNSLDYYNYLFVINIRYKTSVFIALAYYEQHDNIVLITIMVIQYSLIVLF